MTPPGVDTSGSEGTGHTVPVRRHWTAARHWTVLLAYVALTALMTWPLTPDFFTAIPGDSFDGWQNYWNLWWLKLALVDRLQNPFFTDILFAPTGVGLYFHTLNPFNGLVTLPVQLSAGLLPAYNTVVFLSWALAGYGVYLLTRYALRAAPGPAVHSAAFIAGAIFTFSPFHMAHLLGHMQVMSLQWIPFYTLCLLRSMDRAAAGQPWLNSALMAGLFLVLTGLCDWYFVLYLMLCTGFIIIGRWLGQLSHAVRTRDRTQRTGDRIRPLWAVPAPAVVAGSVFAVALSPILVPMVQEVRAFSFMVRPATDLYILSASLADFLVPNRLHTLFRPESFTWIGNQIAPVSERTITIGYVPLLLAGMAFMWKRTHARLWIGVALFFVLLALGPRLHLGNITWDDIPQENSEATLRGAVSPFGWMNRAVPLVRMSRSVSRYALMVQLAVSVAAGIGLAALAARVRRPRGPLLVAGAALALILAEFWVVPYPQSPPDTPPYYTRLDAEAPPGAVLNVPMNWDRPGYLLYQTVHGRPLTVAYISRDDPRTATTRYPVLQHLRHLGPDIVNADPAQVGKTVLSDLGVGAVVLDRYKMPGGDERTISEAYVAAVFGSEPPLYEDDRLTVYAVSAPSTPTPYLALGPLHWGDLQVAQSETTPQETTARWRVVGTQPAQVTAHHLRAPRPLLIRFAADETAGASDTRLRITGPDGAVQEFAAPDNGSDSGSDNGDVSTARINLAPPIASEAASVELQAIGGPLRVYALALGE